MCSHLSLNDVVLYRTFYKTGSYIGFCLSQACENKNQTDSGSNKTFSVRSKAHKKVNCL